MNKCSLINNKVCPLCIEDKGQLMCGQGTGENRIKYMKKCPHPKISKRHERGTNMKALIVFMILLVVLPVGGQENYTISTPSVSNWWNLSYFCFSTPEDTLTTVVGQDTIRAVIDPYSAMVILTLLQQYDEYEKECYADSTAVTFGYFRSWDTSGEFKAPYQPKGGEYYPNLLRTERGYTHRDPSFPGFIKFLQKKVNFKAKSQTAIQPH